MHIDHCLEFLLFLQSHLKLSIKAVQNAHSFLSICHKLAGRPFMISEQELLGKCLNGLLNKNPQQITRAPVCWDVETMIQYLCQLPPNNKITLQALGGKAALLILLSTMCRSGEVAQLRLSGIATGVNAAFVTFHLKELTKNFNIDSIHKAGLQKLTIRKLPSNPSICPVTTLIDYIKLSLPFRKGEDKLFILPGPKFGAAKRQTVIRWIKDHFTGAGLGSFTVHSTRSSTSTSALLLGMPVDEIVAKVGWFSESTFIKTYMRPLEKFQNSFRHLTGDSSITHSPSSHLTPTNIPNKMPSQKPNTAPSFRAFNKGIWPPPLSSTPKVVPSTPECDTSQLAPGKVLKRTHQVQRTKTEKFARFWKLDRKSKVTKNYNKIRSDKFKRKQGSSYNPIAKRA